MEHFYRIRAKVRGFEGRAMTFRPNRFQRRNNHLVSHDRRRRIIKLKARQRAETTSWRGERI